MMTSTQVFSGLSSSYAIGCSMNGGVMDEQSAITHNRYDGHGFQPSSMSDVQPLWSLVHDVLYADDHDIGIVEEDIALHFSDSAEFQHILLLAENIEDLLAQLNEQIVPNFSQDTGSIIGFAVGNKEFELESYVMIFGALKQHKSSVIKIGLNGSLETPNKIGLVLSVRNSLITPIS